MLATSWAQRPGVRRTRQGRTWPLARLRRKPPVSGASPRSAPPPSRRSAPDAYQLLGGVVADRRDRRGGGDRPLQWWRRHVEDAGQARQQGRQPRPSASDRHAAQGHPPERAPRSARASAPVTVTEYGDLECPVCKPTSQLGAEEHPDHQGRPHRQGQARLQVVPDGDRERCRIASVWSPSSRPPPTRPERRTSAWNYIETFYHEQGTEGHELRQHGSYLNGLAKQINRPELTRRGARIASTRPISRRRSPRRSGPPRPCPSRDRRGRLRSSRPGPRPRPSRSPAC